MLARGVTEHDATTARKNAIGVVGEINDTDTTSTAFTTMPNNMVTPSRALRTIRPEPQNR